MILSSLCCREKVPAAGQALQEQMHKGITELKRLASEPLGPEVTKKTEAAISYVDTTYQKLISTPAGGLWWQRAMLSWMDLKSLVKDLPCCGHLQKACCPCPAPMLRLPHVWLCNLGCSQLWTVAAGGLRWVVRGFGAGPCTERQHERLSGGML